jgi:predicted phosphodiesterase
MGAEPMRLGLLADIHANREALEACLDRLSRERIDRLVLLGDIVGYGADPVFTLETAMRLQGEGALVLRGNHDQAVFDPEEKMNAVATAAMDWTRRQLSPEHAGWLRSLPYTHRLGDVLFTHANAWTPQDFDYTRNAMEAERNLRATDAAIVFCGHTHVAALYHAAPMRPPTHFRPLPGTTVPLVSQMRWVGVIGAVGQPRDGGSAAACAVYDVDQRQITFLRVAYDAGKASGKVLAAGLPASLAERLLKGN